MSSIRTLALIDELSATPSYEREIFLKTRLDVLLKPIVGKLSEKNAPQIKLNDIRNGRFWSVKFIIGAGHPERSEGSGSPDKEILRCALGDSQDISQVRSREAFSPNVCELAKGVDISLFSCYIFSTY